MQVYYDRDADRSYLKKKRIAVIGYGSQGHAQANNLKDSDYDVVVGLRPQSPSWAKAEKAGLRVVPVAQAAAEGDIVMMLVPDELAPEVYASEIAPSMKAGKYLAFSHGFSIHYGFVRPPEEVSVFMVAPKGPGHLVRHEYTRGAGVPCLFAVHQDPKGDARQVALAYASAIGGGRAGVIETTFREETETDLFGEQAVLCGGLTSLVQAGFANLVGAGYVPEMAFFEWLRVIGPETKRRMCHLLSEIRSGDFAREWMEEHANGRSRFRKLTEEGKQHPIEVVGGRLRAMMPWLSEKRLVDKARN